MILDQLYLIASNALPHHVCDDIVKRASQIKEQEGTVFHGVDKNVRNSRITWLNEKWIYDWINPFIYETNIKIGWNINLTGNESAQFTIYRENQFYGWHRDSLTNEENKERKISVVIPLVDENQYEGGDLQFYDHLQVPTSKNERIVENKDCRKKGSAIIFPSYVHHQVTKVTKGERLSLVMWFIGEKYK